MNLAAIVASLLVSHGEVATSHAETEKVTAGSVIAELRYDRVVFLPRDEPASYNDFRRMRVVIARDGDVVYRSSLYDMECERHFCHPADRLTWEDRERSIAVRDLDADGEPDAIVDLRLGGAHDRCYTIFYEHEPPTYRPLRHAFDEPCYEIRNLDGDRTPEIIAADTSFTTRFATSGPAYVRPLQIARYRDGRLVDVTRSFPNRIRRERDGLWRSFMRIRKSRNGNLGVLAAWAANEYRLGRREQALQTLYRLNAAGFLRERFALPRDAHNEDFIRELDAYLLRRGYGP